jgi:group I intron endonuclease
MFIYLITNTITNKKYIGQTRESLAKRWRGHLRCAKSGIKTPFYDAIRLYGDLVFKTDVLEQCTVELLNEREVFWIKRLNTCVPNGYNLLSGGNINDFPREVVVRRTESIRKFWKNNLEAKKKASFCRKNGWDSYSEQKSEEVCNKMSEASVIREQKLSLKVKKEKASTGGQALKEKVKNMTDAEYREYCVSRKEAVLKSHRNMSDEKKKLRGKHISEGKRRKKNNA